MSYSPRDSRPDTRYRSSASAGRRTSTSSRSQGGRSRSGARASSSRSNQGRRANRSTRGTRGSAGTRDRGTRARNLTGPDTGYTLHSHRVSYSRRNGDPLGFINGRFILLVIIVIVVVVVLITGISSCVSGSSRSQEQEQQTEEEQTESKPRVASGISSELTSEFNAVLDRDDLLAQIAQNADQYDDERLLTLALNEPEAVSFVANYLTADKSASSYTDTVTQGQVPQLFDWDTRWGYVSYGDGCIGVTGSGPTTVAMAYMGLTGKSDKTPATIAQAVSTSSTSASSSSNNNGASSSSNSNSSSSNSSSSTSYDSVDSMIELMSQAGLDATQYDSSSDTLEACLSSTSVAAVYIDEDGLQDNRDAHWALVVGMNSDGTLNVFDPTSSVVSARTWDSSTIARASSTILYVTVSESAQEDEDETTSSDSSSTYGSSSSGTSTSSSGSSSSNSQGSSASSSSNANKNSGSTSTSNSGSSSTSSSSSSGSSSSGDYIGL